jgi:hypothetical protein
MGIRLAFLIQIFSLLPTIYSPFRMGDSLTLPTDAANVSTLRRKSALRLMNIPSLCHDVKCVRESLNLCAYESQHFFDFTHTCVIREAGLLYCKLSETAGKVINTVGGV